MTHRHEQAVLQEIYCPVFKSGKYRRQINTEKRKQQTQPQADDNVDMIQHTALIHMEYGIDI